MQILLSNSQAGTDRTFKREQEDISRNHVQAFILGPVQQKSVRISSEQPKNTRAQGRQIINHATWEAGNQGPLPD